MRSTMISTGISTGIVTALMIGSATGCPSDDGGSETSSDSSNQTSGESASGSTATEGTTVATDGVTTNGVTTNGVTTDGTATGTTAGPMPWVDWDMLECGTQTCGPTELCVHDEWNGATDDGDGDSTYCNEIPPECLADFEACDLGDLCQYVYDSYADGHLYCSCDDECI